jgi:cell division protein FtsB
MASRLLAAFIASVQLTSYNGDKMIIRSLNLAFKLALKADHAIESDDERKEQ